jgi:ribosome-binding protein aMBF1 (putative translation factor)
MSKSLTKKQLKRLEKEGIIIPFENIFKEMYDTPEKLARFHKEHKKFREECKRELLEEIGTDVKKTRKKKGLTQADLARILNTSRTTVTRIEQGRQNLTVEYIAKLSGALGKTIKVSMSR